MIDKVGRLAERVATNVSRRGFLGRLGRRALALAAAVGGLLALPAAAHAAHVPCCNNVGKCKPPHGHPNCLLINSCVNCPSGTGKCCQWACVGLTFFTPCV